MTNPDNHTDSPARELAQAWLRASASVLGQIAGGQTSVEELAAGAGEPWTAATAAPVRFRFSLSGHLQGEFRVLLCAADAVRLAQLFVGEPPDGSGELNPEREDALGELLRQMAGSVALALRSRLGGDVNFQLTADAAEPGDPSLWSGLRLAGQQVGSTVLWINTSGVREIVVQPAPSPQAAPAPPAPSSAPGPRPAPAPSAGEGTLDGLMGVHLDVVLRFGEQQMTLGEILELTSGAVVELDKQVNEPADLLVGGQLFARGEVVIVDGNYGLRVTELVHSWPRNYSLPA